MARATTYRVQHTTIDGLWNEGEFVTEADLKRPHPTDPDRTVTVDHERLLSLGALRKATAEELEALDQIGVREKQAEAAAEDMGLSPAQTEAAIEAQSTSGNILDTTPAAEPAPTSGPKSK